MFLKTKFKTRLIFSVLMLGATALTLTTSTFAWFATNRNAWFDEIELQIGNADSLLVSVDGSSYRSSIPSDMLKRAVVAKKLGIDYNDSRLDEETYLKSEWAKVSLEPITTYDLDTFDGIDNKHVLTEDENGKVSVNINTIDMASLKKALKKAISTENYELASTLRDEIKRREEESSQNE